ncbi:hypothetical protein [Actinomadura opuntiae]|uniref:hypothetical protein n=1 Tax=Actinomadura sp. OS1-43 TaxID=604315 RepID=UPI00255AD632|nr:hypothetical protein [Actinomadura sp. OS1-43]MDL4812805.1 hypothetical protein [Actinomadura sp. OS1-43]
MPSSRWAFAAVVAVSAVLVSGCDSGGDSDRPAAGAATSSPARPAASASGEPAPTSSEPSPAASPSTTAPSTPAQDGECPRSQIPLPDNATIKSETHSGVAGVPCLQYSVTMRIGDARAAWENTQAKAKAAGYEVEADKEPAAYAIEAKHNEASPWSVITYTFGEGEAQILAEYRHS